MARISGYTIFCDDIRQEVAGKTSYIGVYMDTLVTNAPFPMTLPKFGISITLFYSPLKSKKVGEIPFKVFLPGAEAPALEGSMPLPDMVPPVNADGKMPTVRMIANIILAPLQIKEAGQVRVEAVIDGSAMELGRLQVDQTDPAALKEGAEASAT